jgi:Zn-dependent protease with chaperone function
VRRRRSTGAGLLPQDRRARAAALAGTAALGAGGIVALLRWKLWSQGVPAPAPARVSEWFDPAELARNRDYRRGVWTMAVAGAPLGAATAIAIACLGGRWRPAVVRAARTRPWRAGAVFGAGLTVATTAVGLPLAAARYGWGRHYGLVTQSVPGWLLDLAKGLGIQLAVAAVLGAGAAAVVARAPRWWWAITAAAIAGFVYLFSLLSPLVLEPLFQRTEPLRDPALSAEILQLARRDGITAERVEVNDASSRTTAANAYVSGLGDSRHIVLYDTLLRDFPRDQVRMVVAHELTHVARSHVLKGSTWGAALAVPGSLLVFALVGWRTGFGDAGRGEERCDLVLRRLAVAAAGLAVVTTLGVPLGNWVSRAYESEADWGGIALSGSPRAAIGLQQGLTARSLGVPDPPGPIQLWFGSHPTAIQRIGLALRAEGR